MRSAKTWSLASASSCTSSSTGPGGSALFVLGDLGAAAELGDGEPDRADGGFILEASHFGPRCDLLQPSRQLADQPGHGLEDSPGQDADERVASHLQSEGDGA